MFAGFPKSYCALPLHFHMNLRNKRTGGKILILWVLVQYFVNSRSLQHFANLDGFFHLFHSVKKAQESHQNQRNARDIFILHQIELLLVSSWNEFSILGIFLCPKKPCGYLLDIENSEQIGQNLLSKKHQQLFLIGWRLNLIHSSIFCLLDFYFLKEL